MEEWKGGIKCFSTATRFSSSILVTFPWNKCLLLGLLVWEELKGRWENSVPFWDVGIFSLREKRKETCKGPAEKVFSNMLWRGFVTLSVHRYICSLFDLNLRFFGGTYSKPFVSLTLPECGDLIFRSEVRESLLYNPWLSSALYIQMVPIASLALKLKVESLWGQLNVPSGNVCWEVR